jgi:hypothetical protein
MRPDWLFDTVVALALVAAGCGSSPAAPDDLSVADLAMPDFAAGTPLCQPPATVPDPLIVAILVHDVAAAFDGMPGVLVEMRKRSDDTVLTSGITDSVGSVTLIQPSGGKPIDAYLRATLVADGGVAYTPTELERQGGLFLATEDINLHPPSIHHDYANAAGTPWNEANEIADIAFSKCNSRGFPVLAGAAITVVPGGKVVYQGAGGFNPTLTETTTGSATDFNVPPGNIAMDVVYKGARTSYPTRARGGRYHLYFLYP